MNILFIIGIVIFLLYKICEYDTKYQTPSGEKTPPPARPYTSLNTAPAQKRSGTEEYRGGKYQILNSEGEIYTVDTSQSSSFFFGPEWDKILRAYTEGKYLRAKVCFRRRGSDNYFAGYQLDIHGIPAFLPRSKCAYFWNEEVDGTGKNVIVKPFSLYPSGAKMGNLLVDAVAPIKELDRQPQENWMIGSYFDSEKFYFAGGKNKTFWCDHFELYALSRKTSEIKSFEDATGRYYKVEKCGKTVAGRVHPLAVLE